MKESKRRGKRFSMSLIFSIGKNGGFYFHNGYTKRLCLWRVAITYMPIDIDEIFIKN